VADAADTVVRLDSRRLTPVRSTIEAAGMQ